MAEDVVKIIKIETNGAERTVRGLKEEINGLRDALLNVDKNSEEYSKIVEELVKDQKELTDVMRAGKDEVEAAAGSYNALQNEMTALRKVWKEVTSEAERSKIGARIKEINDQLKEMDASIGNNQRKVGDYEGAMRNVLKTPQQELRELRKELANLTVGTDEYNRVFTRMAQLTHDVREQQEMLKYSSADLGDILSNITGVAQGIAGGISAINAAMGLLGNENEDLQKAMLTAQRFIQLIQGIGALEDLSKKMSGLITGVKNFAKSFKAGSASLNEFKENTEGAANSTKALSNAEKEAAVSTGIFTKALGLLKSALIATGIGALIVALGALLSLAGKGIKQLWEWITGSKAAKDAFDAETKSIEGLTVAMERHIEFMKAQGKNVYEVFIQQLKDLDEMDAKLMMHYADAVNKFKKNSDEIKEAREAWEKNTEKTAETVADIINAIEEMASEVEKADRQKGMTQLEKDTEAVNEQFATAILLLEEMKKSGKMAAETADEYINRLKADLPKALEALKTKNTNKGSGGKSVWEKEEEEIKRVAESIKNFGKTEEEILTETFNHNLALFKKHHKDTTILEKKYQEELRKIKEETAQKLTHVQEVGLENARDSILKGNEEWYKADIKLKDAALKNLKKGEKESDEEFEKRKLAAEEALLRSEAALTDFQNRQEELKLQNQRDIIKRGAREWYEADARLKKAQLDNLVQGLDESMEEFEARRLAAQKEYEDSLAAIGAYDKYGAQLNKDNNAAEIGGEYGIDSMEYYNARLESAIWYRDNLMQIEDETNEEFRARQIMANNEVLELDRQLKQQRIANSVELANGIASIMSSIADAYEDDIKAQVEAGKISQEEGEKRFEQVKGMQIAIATIQMLSGIAAALSGVFTTKSGPWDIALAAVQAATIAASGIAQISKIKNTKLGGSSGSMGSTTYAVAQPNMANDYNPNYVQNITGEQETENLKNALASQPIWVSVTDINSAQNRVVVRDNETTF